MRFGIFLFLFVFVAACCVSRADDMFKIVEVPEGGLSAVGCDSRIDLRWHPDADPNVAGYNVYRAVAEKGAFERLNRSTHHYHVYSDFFGENNRTYWYRVTKVFRNNRESEPTNTVAAQSRAMTDEELLTSVQLATFQYFWDFAVPESGLARTRLNSHDTCSTGATGFGLMAIMVAAERAFVTRQEAAERTLEIVAFLQDKTERFHGAWAHRVNGVTGKTVPSSKDDDGGDLVETSYVIQGMLTVRQYFNQDNFVEQEIRRRTTEMWHEVEWDWYLQNPDSKLLYWHWSPRSGWKMNLPITGYNECMITYLLAIASPTHPIPAVCYYEGWADRLGYYNGKKYYGYQQWVGPDLGGPLFMTQYSFLGFDPRGKHDKYCNYFENSRNITLINRAYCIENPRKYKGYNDLVWGLTASDAPGAYRAHAPGEADDGTITPTAALSAMPYTPSESIAAMKQFYHIHGLRLWGHFGFKDAFNLEKNWFAESHLAIDEGPIVCMIENYRSGLCWKMFMANSEIVPMLEAIGWKNDSGAQE